MATSASARACRARGSTPRRVHKRTTLERPFPSLLRCFVCALRKYERRYRRARRVAVCGDNNVPVVPAVGLTPELRVNETRLARLHVQQIDDERPCRNWIDSNT